VASIMAAPFSDSFLFRLVIVFIGLSLPDRLSVPDVFDRCK
jgi:hypothetical protein